MVRLIPIYSLSADLILEEADLVIHLVHESSGSVFLAMCDNHKSNQSFYRLMRDKYGVVSDWSVNHPVPNSVYPSLLLLYDPTHLFKNICNNWLTEKNQTLEFRDLVTKKRVVAKWKDLVSVYKDECDSALSYTRLTYVSLFPNNLERQKVHLVMNIFHEKTVAALKKKGFLDTSIFVERVKKMWNILNVKDIYAGVKLSDPDRYVIRDEDDERLQYLGGMAQAFSEMNPRMAKKSASGMLTIDTSDAISLTLRGLVELTKKQLRNGAEYVKTRRISE